MKLDDLLFTVEHIMQSTDDECSMNDSFTRQWAGTIELMLMRTSPEEDALIEEYLQTKEMTYDPFLYNLVPFIKKDMDSLLEGIREVIYS